MEALDKEKVDLRTQIAQVLEDRQQLMHLKMSLSLEVATYRSLLEAESSRVHSPRVDYNPSSTFTDSLKDQTVARKRQDKDIKNLLSSSERRPTTIKKQRAKQNEVLMSSSSHFPNVRTSTFEKRTSPATKEFQKVSSVLQSQSLHYAKAPTVRPPPSQPKTESNLERRPQSVDVYKKTNIETVSKSYSLGSSKTKDLDEVKKERKEKPAENEQVRPIDDTEAKQNGALEKPGVESHSPSMYEGLTSQMKQDNLEFTLENFVEANKESVFSIVQEVEQKLGKPEEDRVIQPNGAHHENHQIYADILKLEILDDKVPNIVDRVESEENEVIKLTTGTQSTSFTQQEITSSHVVKSMEEEKVAEPLDFPKIHTESNEASSPEVADSDQQQETPSPHTTVYTMKEFELLSTDNDNVSDIIRKKVGGLLGSNLKIASVSEVEYIHYHDDDSQESQRESLDDQLHSITLLDGQWVERGDISVQADQDVQRNIALHDLEQKITMLLREDEQGQLADEERMTSENVFLNMDAKELFEIDEEIVQQNQSELKSLKLNDIEDQSQFSYDRQSVEQLPYIEEQAQQSLVFSVLKQDTKEFVAIEEASVQKNPDEARNLELYDMEDKSIPSDEHPIQHVTDTEEPAQQYDVFRVLKPGSRESFEIDHTCLQQNQEDIHLETDDMEEEPSFSYDGQPGQHDMEEPAQQSLVFSVLKQDTRESYQTEQAYFDDQNVADVEEPVQQSQFFSVLQQKSREFYEIEEISFQQGDASLEMNNVEEESEPVKDGQQRSLKTEDGVQQSPDSVHENRQFKTEKEVGKLEFEDQDETVIPEANLIEDKILVSTSAELESMKLHECEVQLSEAAQTGDVVSGGQSLRDMEATNQSLDEKQNFEQLGDDELEAIQSLDLEGGIVETSLGEIKCESYEAQTIYKMVDKDEERQLSRDKGNEIKNDKEAGGYFENEVISRKPSDKEAVSQQIAEEINNGQHVSEDSKQDQAFNEETPCKDAQVELCDLMESSHVQSVEEQSAEEENKSPSKTKLFPDQEESGIERSEMILENVVSFTTKESLNSQLELLKNVQSELSGEDTTKAGEFTETHGSIEHQDATHAKEHDEEDEDLIETDQHITEYIELTGGETSQEVIESLDMAFQNVAQREEHVANEEDHKENEDVTQAEENKEDIQPANISEDKEDVAFDEVVKPEDGKALKTPSAPETEEHVVFEKVTETEEHAEKEEEAIVSDGNIRDTDEATETSEQIIKSVEIHETSTVAFHEKTKSEEEEKVIQSERNDSDNEQQIEAQANEEATKDAESAEVTKSEEDEEVTDTDGNISENEGVTEANGEAIKSTEISETSEVASHEEFKSEGHVEKKEDSIEPEESVTDHEKPIKAGAGEEATHNAESAEIALQEVAKTHEHVEENEAISTDGNMIEKEEAKEAEESEEAIKSAEVSETSDLAFNKEIKSEEHNEEDEESIVTDGKVSENEEVTEANAEALKILETYKTEEIEFHDVIKTEEHVEGKEEAILTEEHFEKHEEAILTEEHVEEHEEAILTKEHVEGKEEAILTEEHFEKHEEAILTEEHVEEHEEAILTEEHVEGKEEAILTEENVEEHEEAILTEEHFEEHEEAILTEEHVERKEEAILTEEHFEEHEEAILTEEHVERKEEVILTEEHVERKEEAILTDEHVEVHEEAILTEEHVEEHEEAILTKEHVERKEEAILTEKHVEEHEEAILTEEHVEEHEEARLTEKHFEKHEEARLTEEHDEEHETILTEEHVQEHEEAILTEKHFEKHEEARLTEDPVEEHEEAILTEEHVQEQQEARLTEQHVQEHEEAILTEENVQEHEEALLTGEHVEKAEEPILTEEHVQECEAEQTRKNIKENEVTGTVEKEVTVQCEEDTKTEEHVEENEESIKIEGHFTEDESTTIAPEEATETAVQTNEYNEASKTEKRVEENKEAIKLEGHVTEDEDRTTAEEEATETAEESTEYQEASKTEERAEEEATETAEESTEYQEASKTMECVEENKEALTPEEHPIENEEVTQEKENIKESTDPEIEESYKDEDLTPEERKKEKEAVAKFWENVEEHESVKTSGEYMVFEKVTHMEESEGSVKTEEDVKENLSDTEEHIEETAAVTQESESTEEKEAANEPKEKFEEKEDITEMEDKTEVTKEEEIAEKHDGPTMPGDIIVTGEDIKTPFTDVEKMQDLPVSKGETIESSTVTDLDSEPRCLLRQEESGETTQELEGYTEPESEQSTENKLQCSFDAENETECAKAASIDHVLAEPKSEDHAENETACSEVVVGKRSVVVPFTEAPSEVSHVYLGLGYEDNAVTSEVPVAEEQNESQNIVNLSDNEISESEESVESQEEVSLLSQQSEDFETNSVYHQEKTLPDTTPLPSFDMESEDVLEEQADLPSDQFYTTHREESHSTAESEKQSLSVETFVSEETEENESTTIIHRTEEYYENDDSLPSDAYREDTLNQQKTTCLKDRESSDGTVEESVPEDNIVSTLSQGFVSQIPAIKTIVEEEPANINPVFDQDLNGNERGINEEEDKGQAGHTDLHMKDRQINISADIPSTANAHSPEGLGYNILQENEQVEVKQTEDLIAGSEDEASGSSDEDSPNTTISFTSGVEVGRSTGASELEHFLLKQEEAKEEHKEQILVPNDTAQLEAYTLNEENEMLNASNESSYDLTSEFQERETHEHFAAVSEFENLNSTNVKAVNGQTSHEEYERPDWTVDMLNGHSEKGHLDHEHSCKQGFILLESDQMYTHHHEFRDDSIISFTMREGKNEGLFKSLHEASQQKTLISTDKIHPDSPATTDASMYLESNEENRYSKQVQNPYLIEKDLSGQPQMISIQPPLTDEGTTISTNQQGKETHEGPSSLTYEAENSWSSDE
uniref:IF rod domain-containing protein n=1 Tax=Leptobrachium leishanense TaxID=445787 RepID=A0A8C5WLB0_9ANUR